VCPPSGHEAQVEVAVNVEHNTSVGFRDRVGCCKFINSMSCRMRPFDRPEIERPVEVNKLNISTLKRHPLS
jgi:hypothetical protein